MECRGLGPEQRGGGGQWRERGEGGGRHGAREGLGEHSSRAKQRMGARKHQRRWFCVRKSETIWGKKSFF